MAAKREVKYENGSVYSLVSCSDLTPGSLEVWVELPDQIKYDPSLAPFRHKYELHHGKLEAVTQEDGGATLHRNIPLVSNTQHDVQSSGDHGSKLNVPSGCEDKTVKSLRRKRLDHGLGIIKLSVLVAGWLFLTVSLLMNQETTDVVLHTAVDVGETKEYPLLSSSKRVTVLVTLTGPFAPTTNQSSDKLIIWLSRAENSKFEMNSSFLSINLQPVETIDFSESVTKSKTLVLDEDLISEAAEIEESQDNGEEKNASSVHLRMQSTSSRTVPLTLSYQLDAVSQAEGIMYSVGLLLTLYILIIFEVINRTIAALLSSSLGVAVLAAVGQRPSLPELVSWLDVETLLLLFSMMLLVAILADTGLFDYLAVLAYQMTGGRTWPLINCLCLFTAVFSTFLDNVTTVLLMTPVTIRLCEVMQLNPVPVLMSMVIFSNVGGAATPVGDPPNVIIASHPALLKEVNFTSFTLHMGAGALLVAWQTYAQLRYLYRDVTRLRHSEPADVQEMRQEILAWRRAAASLSSYSRDEDIVRKALEKKVEKLNLVLRKKESGVGTSKSDPKFSATLAQMREKYRIRDKPLLIKSTICVSFVVIVFFLHAFPELQRLSLGWTALLGAMLLLLLAGRELEPALARVEWSTLLFFTALFVLMEVLSKLGLISWIGDKTEAVILGVNETSRLAVALMLILWVSGLASAFVDNIPLTTMMVRVIARLADPTGLALPLAPLAWALSFGACLGGNGTLIGASANVVCAGVAEQHGYRFTFVQFFKIGFPIMIGNLIVSSVYLLVCHCVFTWH